MPFLKYHFKKWFPQRSAGGTIVTNDDSVKVCCRTACCRVACWVRSHLILLPPDPFLLPHTHVAFGTRQPEFDIAEEYVELLYRQFLIMLGISVFPLLTLLAAAGFFVEYVVLGRAGRLEYALVCGDTKARG